MSAYDGKTTLEFREGEVEFAFRLDELRELGVIRKVSPHEIIERLAYSRAFVEDIVEVLRLGAIGAGMTATAAREFINRNVRADTFYECQIHALTILTNALNKVEGDDEPPGGVDGEPDDAEPFKWFGVYEFAGASGTPVSELGKMSLWQFRAYRSGWEKFHNPQGPDDGPAAPSWDDFEEALATATPIH